MSTYPAQFSAPDDNTVANWRPLAHWAMAIPHFIIAGIIALVGEVVAFVAWFAILFTGKLPEGMANVMAMAIRYQNRTNGYFLGLTETYPPFTFDATTEDPGDYDLVTSLQAQLEDRNRLTVFFRLFMMIPLIIVAYVYQIIVGIVMLIAWFAVLFTGKYPEGMRRLTIGFFNYGTRLMAYGFMLTDEYPPFNLTD